MLKKGGGGGRGKTNKKGGKKVKKRLNKKAKKKAKKRGEKRKKGGEKKKGEGEENKGKNSKGEEARMGGGEGIKIHVHFKEFGSQSGSCAEVYHRRYQRSSVACRRHA